MNELTYRGTIVIFALAFQNTALTLALKLSYRLGAVPYYQVEVILLSELIKLAVSLLIVYAHESRKELYMVVLDVYERPRVVIPSLLYVLQNNLIFLAVKHLSRSVYIVSSQGKTITSCLFSCILLKKEFTIKQYVALLLLIFGIIVVQLSHESGQFESGGSSLFGVCCILGANMTSGYAGVLLEGLFKTKSLSIWQRNIQLALCSIPLLLIQLATSKKSRSLTAPLSGFDLVVWLVVLLSSLGGLITAFVMRYASAVLKCFAVSLSICMCSIMDSWQGIRLQVSTLFGIALVCASLFLYNYH